MSQQDLFERILRSLHAAVLDEGRWPAASALIDEACGSKGNTLVFGDGAAQDDINIFFARICRRGQRHTELERQYFEVYHAVDERLPRLRQLPDSLVVPASSLFTNEERKTSVVYNEMLPSNDSRDGLNVRLDGPGGSRIVWSLADPVDRDGWSSARIGTIQCLLPHLRQFVRVRQALVDARALGSSVVELLDNARTGVIQLDRRARVVAANDRAHELLRKGDGLSDQNGFLCASMSADDAELQRLLAQALPFLGGQGVSGSMRVRRPHSLPRLVVHVSPRERGRAGPGSEPPRRARAGGRPHEPHGYRPGPGG